MTNYSVPIIDISALVSDSNATARMATAGALGAACREAGFFYIVGHGVDPALQDRLEVMSRRFFALDLASKMDIAMPKARQAWRGYFPVGDELTSGKPDLKEGLYFGTDLGPEHPDVKAALPLHGMNQYPASLPEMREVVTTYLGAMSRLAHALMEGLALSLGLEATYFYDHYTADPLILFRIFHYPPPQTAAEKEQLWGVGEHTDYGVLTILKQDDCGGLEVKSRGGWVQAPPVLNSFICNIGDMLDRMTGGLYRSTPHRVRNSSGRSRFSWPFFFDPNFHAEVKKIPLPSFVPKAASQHERWDNIDVHSLKDTYGEYLLGKVGKVFPGLKKQALDGGEDS